MQDGIVVTKQLGLQYLWVDATCLIQDSAIDNRVQIERMGDTFFDAVTTIINEDASAGDPVPGVGPHSRNVRHCNDGAIESERLVLELGNRPMIDLVTGSEEPIPKRKSIAAGYAAFELLVSSDPLEYYNDLTTMYPRKVLSHEEDTLNAVVGRRTSVGEVVWGLPVDQIHATILWVRCFRSP